jgi:electron transfer flavoprotein alpha subunit
VILVFVEHDDGRLERLSLEALTFARRLAGELGEPVEAVVVGADGAGAAATAGGHGVAVLHVADLDVASYAPEAWARAALEVIAGREPSLVVAPGSVRAAEVMAHVAARLELPLATNCLDVTPAADGPWAVTRQRWAGSLIEEATLDAPIKLVTMAPHAVEVAEPAAGGTSPSVELFNPALSEHDRRVQLTRRLEPEPGAISLADARVVVGGGRGVGSAEGFAMLEELASLLGGTVGVSRAVTSAGWRPHTEQVGQTGTRIAPDLYIACGISGAIQHIVGCKAAKHILAINTDRDAPIMAQADYAVIGDLRDVVPAIVDELKRGG